MRTTLSVIMTLVLVAYIGGQFWIAYQLTYTVTALGGPAILAYLVACPVLFWAVGRYFLPRDAS